MSKNKNLHNAKANKEDEFYTCLSDIERELRYYRNYFKDKTVLCNCDDPYESNFFKYFSMNFNKLKLKKLICIGYEDSPIAGEQISLFDARETKPAHVLEITEVKDFNEDGRTDLSDIEWLLTNDKNVCRELQENGDFRSKECIEILKEADVVVTNPPFSLFRDYLEQLIKYEKDFLILGNQNMITYKEVFPLIKDNEVWLGNYSGDMAFRVPPHYKPRKTRFWVDDDGQKWRSMGNICWFTNIDYKQRHEGITLYKEYEPEKYPKYENYNAIEVNYVKDIPFDYFETMGVPITFLNKYSPDQFIIIGIAKRGAGDPALKTKVYTKEEYPNYSDLNAGPVLLDDNGKPYNLYPRILIKRKK